MAGKESQAGRINREARERAAKLRETRKAVTPEQARVNNIAREDRIQQRRERGE